MQDKVFLCLCVCAIANGVLAQVASLCRPNERLLVCGCPKTCEDPAPNCKAVCRMGCYCEEGQVRNATGHCVKLADCPPILSAFKQDTTEPRANNGDCPDHEEYRFCESCIKSCSNPNPVCPAQCSRGCFCKGNLLRDNDGKCVPPEKCSHTLNPMVQFTCNEHQIYKPCETCEKTCSNPKPKCPTACKMGCFCEEGLVKAPDGRCVKLNECPRAEVTLDAAHSPSIEECSPDEAYFSCGWCEPSCEQPTPTCPPGLCTSGCLCRPPLLRHHSGHCVEQKECMPQKCSEPNEEFVCQYGCEPRCDPRPCVIRSRRCSLGCHCRLGLLRDIATGLCVTEDKCSNTTVLSGNIARFADDMARVYQLKILT